MNWDNTIMLSPGEKEMYILDITQIYNDELNSA